MSTIWLTVLYKHIGYIPEDKGHGPARLGVPFFSIIPRVPAPVDLPRAKAVDVYPFPRDDEASSVVLEGDWVGIVSPVV